MFLNTVLYRCCQKPFYFYIIKITWIHPCPSRPQPWRTEAQGHGLGWLDSRSSDPWTLRWPWWSARWPAAPRLWELRCFRRRWWRGYTKPAYLSPPPAGAERHLVGMRHYFIGWAQAVKTPQETLFNSQWQCWLSLFFHITLFNLPWVLRSGEALSITLHSLYTLYVKVCAYYIVYNYCILMWKQIEKKIKSWYGYQVFWGVN